jgi:hypothetical protein
MELANTGRRELSLPSFLLTIPYFNVGDSQTSRIRKVFKLTEATQSYHNCHLSLPAHVQQEHLLK